MMRDLEVLVGEWDMKPRFPQLPPVDGSALVTFEWMDGGEFLVERWTVPVPEAPDGLAVIGPDPDEPGQFLQHYFDTRGVARIYRMSFAGGVWKLWRDVADFSALDFRQRFAGRLSDDGNQIEGAWEICHDGETWEHDFDLTYRRR